MISTSQETLLQDVRVGGAATHPPCTRIGRFVPRTTVRRPASADVFVSADNSLVVIADGLGSNAPNDASAETVIRSMQTLARRLRPGSNREQASHLINLALVRCNATLVGRSRQSQDNTVRGASIMIGLRVGDEVIVKSVGDCRCYLLRDDTLRTVTHDNTLRELLLSTGGGQAPLQGLTRNRGVLKHVGQHDYVPNNEFSSISLTTDDRILFCTRGVTAVLSDPDIKRILARAETPSTAAETLASQALRQDAPSAVVSAAIFVSAPPSGPAR